MVTTDNLNPVQILNNTIYTNKNIISSSFTIIFLTSATATPLDNAFSDTVNVVMCQCTILFTKKFPP